MPCRSNQGELFRPGRVISLLLAALVLGCGSPGPPDVLGEVAPTVHAVTPEPTSVAEARTAEAATAAAAEPAAPTPEAATATAAEPAAPTPEAATAAAAEPAAPTPEVATAEAPAVVIEYRNDFSSSIAPIFADKCAGCHNSGGPGAAHWRLDTAADAVAGHAWIAEVVASEYMPPWPASDRSLVFHENRSLRPDQIAAIATWSADGAPLDIDPGSVISSPTGIVSLDAAVEIVPAQPYQGDRSLSDDYRCLVYDLDIDEARWMSGFEFVPDQTEVVHHAIGYLVPPQGRERANELADLDDRAGWQCYGGSRLGTGDDLFLGWAPGQLPTTFPEGSGLLVEPGSFVVLQIHYHYEREAPPDSSSLKIAWAAEDDPDPIEFAEFIGPAEIPCTTAEVGVLCDRDAALSAAVRRYGPEGVLADGINRLCGVTPEDFAHMTDGQATSACTIPVRNFGQLVAVFGHLHEIGSSFRMTLNAGTPAEQILLDIPDWSFDWQYNYEPAGTVVLTPGDTILIECAWDRSRRDRSLEPAYILWADGTNDEMCFGTLTTRRVSAALSPALVTCLDGSDVAAELPVARDQIDAAIEALFDCAEPGEVGSILSALISDNFGGLITTEASECLSANLATPEGARSLLVFAAEGATVEERLVVGELVADCVSLSGALESFGVTLDADTADCVDEAGYDLVVQASVEGELPEEQVLFRAIGPCLGSG